MSEGPFLAGAFLVYYIYYRYIYFFTMEFEDSGNLQKAFLIGPLIILVIKSILKSLKNGKITAQIAQSISSRDSANNKVDFYFSQDSTSIHLTIDNNYTRLGILVKLSFKIHHRNMPKFVAITLLCFLTDKSYCSVSAQIRTSRIVVFLIKAW